MTSMGNNIIVSVRYLYRGEEVAPTTYAEFEIGVKYEVISPVIEGYQPDRHRIKGKAGINNVGYIVNYYNEKSDA